MNFGTDISSLEALIESERAALQDLIEQRQANTIQTQNVRAMIAQLRDLHASGKAPGTGKRSRIEALDINAETGRPPRGDRKSQIEMISRKLGRAGKEFRTVDVLNEIRQVELSISSGVKSYTYSVMKTLGEEGVLEKVGRGRWKLA